MIIVKSQPKPNELRTAINAAYRMDEDECVTALAKQAQLADDLLPQVKAQARELVTHVREKQLASGGIDSFLSEYDLSNEEGIALMCLAEALLRVPDKQTINTLIRDKISKANWKAHVGQSESIFVNSTTWALLLTGNVLRRDNTKASFSQSLKRFFGQASEPVVRKVVGHAMKIMSRQFVMGQTIEDALKRAKINESKGYRHSYDMLGEAACTMEDAEHYMQAYQAAITAIGAGVKEKGSIAEANLSVKLSALHPRYEFSQRERVLNEMSPKLLTLMQHAKQVGIGLTIDAEEADRLDLSLDLIENTLLDSSLAGWDGFGMALQSYQKRAGPVIDWVKDLAQRSQRRIRLRLIKGAYWDSEIKMSQMLGLSGYPVFTRKANTDISFQACVKKMLTLGEFIYPQFATHNAYSIAMILALVGENKEYEFQCLHGMGEALYENIVPQDKMGIPCRIYAPVGNYENLLPYLVRRLLENGANSSFVNRIRDAKAPIESLITDPVAQAKANTQTANPLISLPQDIYPDRENSPGIDLSDLADVEKFAGELQEMVQKPWRVAPIVGGRECYTQGTEVFSPNHTQEMVGLVQEAQQPEIEKALAMASAASVAWGQTAVAKRAQCLQHTA
ncbi:MAG: bifunctional proline dehydrogenase/L-glutamate gamma-semialdehyde dehydrogenase PutA, partial [Gammaproteobacteria bacterium]